MSFKLDVVVFSWIPVPLRLAAAYGDLEPGGMAKGPSLWIGVFGADNPGRIVSDEFGGTWDAVAT